MEHTIFEWLGRGWKRGEKRERGEEKGKRDSVNERKTHTQMRKCCITEISLFVVEAREGV